MDILIKSFKMIEIKTRKFNKFTFSDRINIISGNNKDGKSTLMKSIMYCLGFDIKKWADSELEKKFIYSIVIVVNNTCYKITRYLNNFIVDDGKNMSLKEYREFLTEIFNIDILFQHKDSNDEEIKKHLPYPTDIFLYNYIDQDSSFENTLFKSNYKSYFYLTNEWTKMYKFFIGIYNEKLNYLEEQTSNLKREISQSNNKISLFEEMLKSLNVTSEEVDYIPLNSEEFGEEIKLFTEEILKINNKKKSLEFKKMVSIKKLRIKELEKMSLEDIYKQLEKEKEITCQLCHNKVENSFAEHYKNEIDKQYILESYSNCKDEINKLNKEIKEFEEEIDVISDKLKNIQKIKNQKEESLNIEEIIERNSDFKMGSRLKSSINSLEESISVKTKEKKEIDKQIRSLKKTLEDRTKEIENFYKKELFNANKYFPKSELTKLEEDFLKFNPKGTGSTASLKKIALYCIYINILMQYSKIKFPILWDSVVYTALDEENGKNLESFINEKLFSLNTQIFFTNIPDSPKDIKILSDEIKMINIHEKDYDNKICYLENTIKEEEYINKIFSIIGDIN